MHTPAPWLMTLVTTCSSALHTEWQRACAGTPIAAIRMALSVLEESGLTAEQQRTLEDIRAANTMLAMQVWLSLRCLHSSLVCPAGTEGTQP